MTSPHVACWSPRRTPDSSSSVPAAAEDSRHCCSVRSAITVCITRRSPSQLIRPFDPSHDRSEERQQRIVVGIDASEPSQRALQWAVEEARLRHASLSAVHAWPLPALVVPFVADMPGLEQAAKELLERALEPIDDSDLDQPIARQLTGGAPAPVLLGAAQAADLVVVGSRGLGGFKELLLGSVSHRLATHARCPVVVIPHPDGQVAVAT